MYRITEIQAVPLMFGSPAILGARSAVAGCTGHTEKEGLARVALMAPFVLFLSNLAAMVWIFRASNGRKVSSAIKTRRSLDFSQPPQIQLNPHDKPVKYNARQSYADFTAFAGNWYF